ncbi:hypothetical protein MKX01_023612 [Papaver californicum]|nr:hypothetical protein MKX01_023612 [Papaver californicum]
MTTKSSSSEFLNINTPIKNSKSSSSSRYLPTVCLEDWWLLRSEDGKRLCIGGLVLTENRAKRVFSSAPITKRYSLRSLKTADGFEILIQGAFYNSRTQENGFSSEPKDVLSSSNKKMFTNMESEDPENLSCSYDTGMDEVAKDAPASTSSDAKNADPNEASVAVPVGILSTKLAKAKGVVTKGKVSRKKKKVTNSRSISGSPGCGVVQVHHKEDINHGSEGKVERSMSETPITASPSVSERSRSCNSRTMEESTLQRFPKADVSRSIEVGLDTLKVAPIKVAATRTSSRLNNIEGRGNENRVSNGGRAPSRIKILGNNLKDDQPTNSVK